jgi:protein TonB
MKTSVLISVVFHAFVVYVLFFGWQSNAWNRMPDKTYSVKVVGGSRRPPRPNQQRPPTAVMRMSAPRAYTAIEPVPVKPGHTAAKLDSLALAPPGEAYYGDAGEGDAGTSYGGYVPPPPEQAQEFYAFDEPPVLLRSQNPVYPELARQAGIEGTVLLNVLVTEDGKVADVSVMQSDVTSAMEKAAEDAVMHFIFKPAKQRTVPVAAHIAVPIRFKIH